MAVRSTVLQDYETMFTNMAYQGVGKYILELFKNKDFLKMMEAYEKAINDGKKRLEESFNQLKEKMEYNWMTKDSDSILDQLIKISEHIDYANYGSDPSEFKANKNFAMDLLNSQESSGLNFASYSEQQQDAIRTFIANYVNMRNATLKASNIIGSTGEIARQDKQFYGILISGIETTSNNTTEKIDKMLMVSRKAFEKFEEEHRELFNFKFSEPRLNKDAKGIEGPSRYIGTEGILQSYSLKNDINNTQLYNILKEYALKDSLGNAQDVLDSNYFGIKNNENKNVTFRDIFNILKDKDQINIPLANSEKGRQMAISRRLELLFDSPFVSAIQNLYSQGNSDVLNQQNMQNIVNQLFPNGYQQESIYGGATGDKNFSIMGYGDIALQLKYKNATRPWNGVGISGLSQAFHSFRTIASKMASAGVDSMNIEALYDSMGADAFSQFIWNIFDKDPVLQANLGEFASTTVAQDFLDFNWNDNISIEQK